MHAAALVALSLATVFGALAALHIDWAFGRATPGPVVPTRPDGGPTFHPGRAATLGVAGALTAAAGVVLGRAGLGPALAPAWLYRVGAWGLGAVLLLRVIGDLRYVGLFKRVRGTRFAVLDTWVYTPLCAALAAGVLYLAGT